jgi:hypothetical protein
MAVTLQLMCGRFWRWVGDTTHLFPLVLGPWAALFLTKYSRQTPSTVMLGFLFQYWKFGVDVPVSQARHPFTHVCFSSFLGQVHCQKQSPCFPLSTVILTVLSLVGGSTSCPVNLVLPSVPGLIIYIRTSEHLPVICWRCRFFRLSLVAAEDVPC